MTFQPGESGPKVVEFDLIDDDDVEPTESFTVSLSSSSRATLGGPSTVNIQDDDGNNSLKKLSPKVCIIAGIFFYRRRLACNSCSIHFLHQFKYISSI